MTETDRVPFAKQMGKLFVTFPEQLTADAVAMRVDEYFETLMPYGLEEIGQAVRDAKAEVDRAFFPKPGELIGLIISARHRRGPELRSLPAPREPTPEEKAVVDGLLRDLYERLAWPRKPLTRGEASG